MRSLTTKTSRTILLLTANPEGTPFLHLEEEVRRISDALERSKRRKDFTLQIKPAATHLHLRRAILDHEPEIVHFCGHGAGVDGIALEGNNGEIKLVSTSALADLFELAQSYVKCVVLNACFAETQANEIVKHIDYVVGMRSAIGNKAALCFAEGFYDALGAGETFEQCFRYGKNSIQLDNIPEDLIPVIKTKSQNGSTLSANKSAPNSKPPTLTNDRKKKTVTQSSSGHENADAHPKRPKPTMAGFNLASFLRKHWAVLTIPLLVAAILILLVRSPVPAVSPIVGSYRQIDKSKQVDYSNFYHVSSLSVVITIFPDPSDSNKLACTSITMNQVFFQKHDGPRIPVGTYMVIWRYKEVSKFTGPSIILNMEGHLVQRFGLEELRKLDLNSLGIDSSNKIDNMIGEVYSRFETAKAVLELKGENSLTRSLKFNERENDPVAETFTRLRN